VRSQRSVCGCRRSRMPVTSFRAPSSSTQALSREVAVERGRSVVFADAADLVCPSPVSVRRHPARSVDLSPLHLKLPGRRGSAGGARTRRVLRRDPPVGAEARAGHRPPPSATSAKTNNPLASGRDGGADCKARGCISGAPWTARARSSTSSCSDERDKSAALKLMRKLLKKQGFAPTVIVTDKLRSYAAAFAELGLAAEHERGLRQNTG